MSIAIYQVQSPLSQLTREHTDEYLDSVSQALGEPISRVSMEEYAGLPFGLIYVASGGSEGIFLSQYDKIAERPCYILTSGESNSLAASMEILSYLRQHGKRGEILHGSVGAIASRIRALDRASGALQSLRGMKLGVLGAPSDWLIASSADGGAYREKLGVELVHVPMEEVLSEIRKWNYSENQWTKKLCSFGYDSEEMRKSLCVYGAFRRLAERYGLAGLTVRCFDLLDTVYTTGCLGLAILNAEGIYGGCEGDVPSLMSMAILGEVSREPVFLCNPSRIDTAGGEMVLAHCTLPLNMPYAMRLTTHYESGIGVAVAGSIPEGTCTVFKTSADLARHFAKTGLIVGNLSEPMLCRTQIKVKLDDFSYFLTEPINNHHLVCVGDWTAALNELFTQLG